MADIKKICKEKCVHNTTDEFCKKCLNIQSKSNDNGDVKKIADVFSFYMILVMIIGLLFFIFIIFVLWKLIQYIIKK
jgi:hypothetical protein